MSLDADIKRRYAVLQIEKGKRQRKLARNLVILVLSIASSASGIYLNFNSGLTVFFILALIGSIMISLIYIPSTLERISSPLSPMEKAFEVIYGALDKDWGATTDEKREPSKDEIYLREHVHGILEKASKELGQEGSEEALDEEISGLLDRTQTNIDSRLIPAIDSGRLSPETLTNLARVIGSPTYLSLQSINSQIELSLIHI